MLIKNSCSIQYETMNINYNYHVLTALTESMCTYIAINRFCLMYTGLISRVSQLNQTRVVIIQK